MPKGLWGISRGAWRDAARLGLQSALSAALSYGAAQVMGDVDAFLVIMMAVTSLQRSVGGTIEQASIRLQSALSGSLLGLACLVLLPQGWGTAVALAVALFVVGLVTALRSSWQLAVVPAVGLSLGDQGDLWHTAAANGAGILLGAAIGVLVSLLVWPDRAEARFERRLRTALRATATRLSDAVAATLEPGREPRLSKHVSAWNEAVWLAQEALGEAKFVDRARMQGRLDALRELHDSIVILDRAAKVQTPPLSVEVMRTQVDVLRRDAVDVLEGMAAGHRPVSQRIGTIDATLQRLRQAMSEEDPAAPEHEAHSAVGFGLREVRRTLAALIEAQEHAQG
jgi:uncharacterized membrane protein YccC